MPHATDPEKLVLFCPRCSGQHEDVGEWSTRPHRSHLCHYCKHLWRPQPFTTFGVALPIVGDLKRDWPAVIVTEATFIKLPDYSCTIPTGPKPEFTWRSRTPYYCEERRATHYMGKAVPMPDDPPGEISIVWRRLLVAEWLIGDALTRSLEAA